MHFAENGRTRRKLVSLLTLAVLAVGLLWHAGEAPAAEDEGPAADRLGRLEKRLQSLQRQVQELKSKQEQKEQRGEKRQKQLSDLSSQMGEVQRLPALDASSWLNKFTLGGYGEMHMNFGGDGDPDQFDIHRIVMYLGYDFNEWIKFHSETELEHAFVSDGKGGELLLEQAYVDFLLSEPFNVRFGRVLTPLGILNKWHEPTRFNGVERPRFSHDVLPTTWSSDGMGIFGRLRPELSYEAYVVGGLDGSEFGPIEGIREGRIHERPSLGDVAFTGRLDYRPFAVAQSKWADKLRLGVSAYYGGIDNGNKGEDPGVDGDISIYSADFEYSISDFDFRGVVAGEKIDGARALGGGVAEEIFGWYLEAAYHFLPEAWKKGRLSESDAVAFVRYEDFDTQHEMPSGVAADPRGDRDVVTLGLTWHFTPNFVAKADYQVKDDRSGDSPENQFNLGIGWEF